MSVQDDIQFYYRRAAEARARGKEALAQTMENYARNLEAGIYDDDGRGFNMAASNQRWAQKEAEEAARRKAAEERLYASRPRGGSRRSGGSAGRNGWSDYSFGGNVEGAGRRVAPMDYSEPDPREISVALRGLAYNDSPSYDPSSEDFYQGSWEEARRPSPRTSYPEVGRPGWRDNR